MADVDTDVIVHQASRSLSVQVIVKSSGCVGLRNRVVTRCRWDHSVVVEWTGNKYAGLRTVELQRSAQHFVKVLHCKVGERQAIYAQRN